MTLEQAKNLKPYDHIYAVDYDASPPRVIRVKVNGKPKTWKRRPNDVLIPVKYGLYTYFDIWDNDLDCWYLTEDEAQAELQRFLAKRKKKA